MNHFAFAFCLTISATAAGVAFAEPPNLKTPTPVIHLVDNLDEADNLGWCIDTLGRGFSERLHAHSCKPQGGDVQFRYDEDTLQIVSVAFETKCATRDATGGNLGLIDCDPENEAQKFTYDMQAMRLHLADAPNACLTIGGASRSAGPFMARDLLISECSEQDVIFQTWIVKP